MWLLAMLWSMGRWNMDGKTVLVTGAASGIGLVAATGFAKMPLFWALTRMVIRKPEQGADTIGWSNLRPMVLGQIRELFDLGVALDPCEQLHS